MKIAGEVKNFDVGPIFPRRRPAGWISSSITGLLRGIQAFRDSGLEVNEANAHRIGVNIGSGIGGLPMIEDTTTIFAGGARKISPSSFPARSST